jgi:hypothetical protein
MITKQDAIEATYRQEFYHLRLRNKSDGRPVRCRVNGACKTWKTRPNDFRLPVKYGISTCFCIDNSNAELWCSTEEEAILASQDKQEWIAFPFGSVLVETKAFMRPMVYLPDSFFYSTLSHDETVSRLRAIRSADESQLYSFTDSDQIRDYFDSWGES